jgi:hypothetical protein
MASITRTVRFEKEEAILIDNFLAQNKFLDFSTLARLAISQFMQNPKISIKPVSRMKLRNRTREKAISMEGGLNG